MSPFDRSYTSSYLSSIVTMATLCIVSEILVGNNDFFIRVPT